MESPPYNFALLRVKGEVRVVDLLTTMPGDLGSKAVFLVWGTCILSVTASPPLPSVRLFTEALLPFAALTPCKSQPLSGLL
jgi:hypothetical protein